MTRAIFRKILFIKLFIIRCLKNVTLIKIKYSEIFKHFKNYFLNFFNALSADQYLKYQGCNIWSILWNTSCDTWKVPDFDKVEGGVGGRVDLGAWEKSEDINNRRNKSRMRNSE